ncbi:MAG: BrnA antitoxin family protein [Symploca sp. SIO2E6]|nr:BrnA antitoxin family protein [Symploca sp. SIO2E6]
MKGASIKGASIAPLPFGEDLDTSDVPTLSEEFFAKAQLRMPKSAVTTTVQVSPKTFAWFQAQGETAQQQMSVALRIYAEAHKIYPASGIKPASQTAD